MLQRMSLGKRLKELFGISKGEDEFFAEMEDILIQSDVGALTTMELVEELKISMKQKKLKHPDEFITELKNIIRGYIKVKYIELAEAKLNIFLVLGVNGVGKTTSIAKIAHFYKNKGRNLDVILCGADTFRAAAATQLKLWGERLQLKVISQEPGADPGAVVFDSIDSALAKKAGVLLIDTSGRMHNKENLVRELVKIDKIVRSKLGGNFYHKLLIIDATTGQNALRQAEVFNLAVQLDSIMLAKYDSQAKGGIVISVGRELKLPISFVGTGEKLEDLNTFDIEDYLNSLLGN
jgi:fused signal recognition particle receptor